MTPVSRAESLSLFILLDYTEVNVACPLLFFPSFFILRSVSSRLVSTVSAGKELITPSESLTSDLNINRQVRT